MTLLVNGSRFNTLAEVEKWAYDEKPIERINVDIIGQHIMPKGLTWRYLCPNGIFFQGINNASLICNSQQWLFVFKPDTPAYIAGTMLAFDDISFGGSGKGGMNLGPVYNGDYNAGGETAWLDRISFTSCRFHDIGSKVCGDPGFAAIYAQGIRRLDIFGCQFFNIANETCKMNHQKLIHAVYAVDGTHADIRSSRFRQISGDPIRVRDRASASVIDSWCTGSGQKAFISSWHQKIEKPGSAEFSNNVISRGYRGQRIKEWAG